MSKLINLHFASEYSFSESPTNLREYVEFAKKNNISILPLTDHNFVFGFAEFRQLCQEHNIKPIYGIDLDVEDFRLILLAKNKAGFNEILKLSYLKSINQNIKTTQISEQNLYVINHPTYGTKNINELKSRFTNLYFYEPNNPESNLFIKDNRIVDDKKQDALFFINQLAGNELDSKKSFLFSTEHPVEEKLIQQTLAIANDCNVTFEEKINLLPDFHDDPNWLLNQWVNQGLQEHEDKLIKYDSKLVQERIKYELWVIKQMEVANYFLIIADLIKWAKTKEIEIGPGRGSVSGSFIAFLIGITQINPLEYNLYFERFLNQERITMPDIDIDIQDDRREEVIEYLKNKYGYENVAQICTFQRIGAKQALKDAGRFLNINFAEVNELSKLIPGHESLALSYQNNNQFQARIDGNETYGKLFDLASKIESLPRQSGIHAAGIVLAKEPIINHCPIMSVDQNLITQFSMEYLESWNLLKIDLLGLRTLTIMKRIEKNVQKIYIPSFSINNIPLDDDKTNKLLSEAKVAGIFQLESPGMMATLNKVKINKFLDLVDVISLFRPGPMSNLPKYLKNKEHPELINHISENYDKVINQTHGIIIYQEQIMEIVQGVAGLSFSQADILRKAISKKNKSEMESMKSLFIAGAIKNDFSEIIANQIFEEIEKFAQYGFNKAHAVAYATISYKMAYLKTRFPICFYASIIELTAALESINKYVKEAKSLKFQIESPTINKISTRILHNEKDTIWLPITFIKGIGSAAAQKLVYEVSQNGPFIHFFDFIARAKKINLSTNVIDALIESNTLREFGNVNTLQSNKAKGYNYAEVALYKDPATEEMKIDLTIKVPQLEYELQDLNQEAQNEIKYLGMIYNAFITSKYETNDKLMNLKPGIEFLIIIHINKKRQVVNKFNKISYILEVSDSSGQDVIFFNEKNKELFDKIQVNTIGYANLIRVEKATNKYLYLNGWKEVR